MRASVALKVISSCAWLCSGSVVPRIDLAITSARQTVFFGNIRQWDGGNSVGIGLILKSSIAPFVKTTQEAMDRYKREVAVDIAGSMAAHAARPASPIEELERLSKLKAAGHLSDAEF